ncbi:MAG TPA: adenylate/guanylate cyclase domain-containing protein [Caldimonas sp.]|nr:adenylate/guanylate cyclase domain-containing protein [Caldimonas sp.]
MTASDSKTRQRLAAILMADAAGYSRLMSCDERGTVAALDDARAVFRTAIDAHRGRVIDMAGDSVLAVFETASGAVVSALAIQAELARRAADVAADCRMQFRIGIHLGDVIEKDDGTVYGDGVNIAARLEGLAEPGGVTVSDAVQCAVRQRLDAAFDDIGEQRVKNIPTPVRAYRVRELAAGTPRAGAAPAPAPAAAPRRDRVDKPSIAVLPFDNMSGDPEQEFFADGITEDIITELSRFRELFVISRNSSFKFKGKPVEVQKFAQELGVQYVVEGSVRKAGRRVRITVQLIDAETDRHLWAERYDRDLEDIFAIQDEVTTSIVATLPGRVEAAARDRAARLTTDNMAAYECVLTGKVLHHRSNREDNAKAQRLLDRAIELDPNYAHAHAWKACVLGQTWTYNWCESRLETQVQIMQALKTALSLDDNDCDVHRILAAVNLIQDKHDQAMYHQRRALSLNPNDDLVVVQQGEMLTWLGQPEEGIDWIKKAMRLNPYHPERFWSHLARACFAARRYGEAVDALKCISTPDALVRAGLAACHAQLGAAEAAEEERLATLALAPSFTIAECLATLHYRDPAHREHHRASLELAGFPA